MCFTGWRGLDSSRSSLCACTSRFVREKLDITESMIFDDEGSESGATALPKPPWSFSPVNLAGGLLSAVAAFPLRAGFARRCPSPLLWRWFREAASAQRLGGPGNKSNGFLQTLHKEERTGKSLQRPVAGVAALPVCWRLRSRGGRNNRCPPRPRLTPRLWQPQKRIRRMALTFTMWCPKRFGGSLPRDSTQRQLLRH